MRAHLEQFRSVLEPRPAGWRDPWMGRKPGTYRWYELQDRRCAHQVAGATAAVPGHPDRPGVRDRPGGALVPDTTVWILPSGDLYLLAVLSSPLYGWYARRRFPPALNGSVRPKLAYHRHFPVAAPSPSERAAIEQLVLSRLALEPVRRAGDAAAPPAARELDDAIATAVFDSYALSAADRELILCG